MPPKLPPSASSASSNGLSDLDAAIRSLESSTNPKLRSTRPACGCNATRHPLQIAAPNCLSCGKIMCVREGLGPCSFCQTPLLSSGEVQALLRTLHEERGREKMQAHNAAQKRAEVSTVPRPFTSTASTANRASAPSDPLSAAEAHRNRLLSYQATSAARTHIIDEAADFETPAMGQSMWASPQERAMQLKRQQKVLREQEWNARPEYEKRRAVVSIDLAGGKVVKRMANVERRSEDPEESPEPVEDVAGPDSAGGQFSRNPLLRGLIRPTYHASPDESTGTSRTRSKPWRRVQDDNDDNEAIILDGGVYGSDAT
ncbi:MAG: hypothetical protein M1838_004482 [Thelocarpon superellum]|nr:MAG: hypothetical protein M1838_004482 [Thelocarpon superellum]